MRLRRQQLLQRPSAVDAFCLHFCAAAFCRAGCTPDFTTAEEADLARIEQETLAATLGQLSGRRLPRLCRPGTTGARTDSTAGDTVPRPLSLYPGIAPPGGIADCVCREKCGSRRPRREQTEWGRELLNRALAGAQGVRRCWRTAAQPSQRGTKKADAAYTAVMLDDAARVENLCYHLKQGDWDKCLSALELVLSGWRAAGRIKGRQGRKPVRCRCVRAARPRKKAARACAGMHCSAAEELPPTAAALHRWWRPLSGMTQTFADNCFAAKCAEKVLDYADYEHLTLDLLVNERNERTPLCRTVSSRYTAVLVDGVSGHERTPCRTLSTLRWPAPEADNLFFVGDIKQSIYRFHANPDPGIFVGKQQQWKPHPQPAPKARPRWRWMPTSAAHPA